MSPSTHRASVVVPVRNAATEVIEQLEALRNQSIADHLEVVIIDDASQDDTADVVRAWIDSHDLVSFRLIERDRRGGPNASRNDGIRATTGDWVLFVDGDDRAHPGWAEALLATLREDRLVGGHLERLNSAPDDPDRWIVRGAFNYHGWEYAPGGNMAAARSLLTALDGFDENLRAGGTETDLAIRAKRAGAQVTSTADAIVAYRVPDRIGDLFVREFHRERGRAYIARRLGVGLVSWRALAYRWIVVGSALKQHLVHRERSGTLAVALARAVGGPIWKLRFWIHLPQFRGLSSTASQNSSRPGVGGSRPRPTPGSQLGADRRPDD